MVGNNNILMLHGSSDLYGASKIFLVTAKTLQEGGRNVVVVLSEDGPLVRELNEIDIEVRLVRLGIVRRKYFNGSGIRNRIRVMKNAYQSLKTLAIEEEITHLYSNTAAVWVGAFLSKKLGLRHIWHLHEIILKPSWFSFTLGRMINRYSDEVIVVSEAVRNHWKKHVFEDKLRLVYNGIDYYPYLCEVQDLRESLGIPKEARVIGMIGRVNSWKGHEYFLEISEELNKKFIDLYFILVGDAYPGDERLYEGLENKILKKEFKEKILNLGLRTDIPRILATLDVFILPSTLPDPFPTVILEAMAAQKPVVATAHGGALEMVEEGISGYHIPWDDPKQAAFRISTLLENKNLLQEMGLNARKRVLENFSLTSFGEKMLKIFS